MSIHDMEDLKQQYLDEMKTLINGKDYRNWNIDIEIKINKLKGNFNEMSIEIRKKEKEQLDDDESSHEEVIHEMSFKTYSNPLFDLEEEIISSEFNLIHNEDLDSTPKDVRIDNINLDPEGDILFLESLLYNNSSPRPPEAFQHNFNTIIESLPIFLIPVKDSDSLREEIDIFPCPDDLIPLGIDSDDFDSEGNTNSTSFPEFESFHVDYPNSGDSTIDVVEDIPVDMPNILATHPALQLDFDFIPSNDLGSDLDVSSPFGDRNKIYDPGICIEVESTRFLATHSPMIDTLLPFSSENEDKAFNHGVLASKEKSPPYSSHRGFKAFQLIFESPMMIHGENTHNLGVFSSPFISLLIISNYPIWEVIQNGNGHVSITTDTQGQVKVLPPRTAEEILARERERKARTTLLMALPEDHLAKFHKITNAKEMWDAIKSRLGENDESKKMQKYILKQQFEGFFVSNSEGLHKGYDRSLSSAWSQVSLIMSTKPGVDSLNFDDLYNNLRVFENDVKGSTESSSSTKNVAFVSENTISTNDVSTAYGVSNPSSHNSQYEQTSSYSLLANQSSYPQLDHEDLEQLDEFDLEEIDLKWQVAMISMRMKKFYKKTGRKLQFDAKELAGFNKTKVECYNCHKTWHFARECRVKGNQDNRRRDAWNSGNKDGRRSGSDTEVTSCSNECKESYAKLKKLYDAQREQLSDASIEIKAYTQSLKKVEAQLVAHQQEAQKEKEDLKAKVEKWHSSSKNLGKLLLIQKLDDPCLGPN
ncbi:ribonuclease H-like domain-containing protein [Tanacetum coccineum]|uniref:Ribonuclease H-like domain-containing protein n=1 Tax=Tanacetum coccineum TaxID=301880 RepID=A0ABQ4Z432_9ASTR